MCYCSLQWFPTYTSRNFTHAGACVQNEYFAFPLKTVFLIFVCFASELFECSTKKTNIVKLFALMAIIRNSLGSKLAEIQWITSAYFKRLLTSTSPIFFWNLTGRNFYNFWRQMVLNCFHSQDIFRNTFYLNLTPRLSYCHLMHACFYDNFWNSLGNSQGNAFKQQL